MPNLPAHIIKVMQTYGIRIPAQLPIFHSPPREKYLHEWADSQLTPKLRAIAHKIVKHLRYVAFAEFLEALRKTIIDFHAKIKDEPYVLLLPESRVTKLTKGCSDQWVIALAFEYCGLKTPINIITYEDLPKFIQENQNIKNILLLDDAAYSGTQKIYMLKDLYELMEEAGKLDQLEHLTIHIGIPFLTQSAKEQFAAFSRNPKKRWVFADINLLEHQILPTMVDILNQEEIAYLKAIDAAYISDHHVITYFDHVYADYMSAYQILRDGDPLFRASNIETLIMFLGFTTKINTAKKYKGLSLISEEQYKILAEGLFPNYHINHAGYNIPIIISPYRVIMPDGMFSAFSKGLLGTRSKYPIYDSRAQSMVSGTSPKQTEIPNYKKSILTSAEQTAIDEAITRAAHEHRTFGKEVLLRCSQRPNNLPKVNRSTIGMITALLAFFAVLVRGYKHRNEKSQPALTDQNHEPPETGTTPAEQEAKFSTPQKSAFFSNLFNSPTATNPVCTNEKTEDKHKTKKKLE